LEFNATDDEMDDWPQMLEYRPAEPQFLAELEAQYRRLLEMLVPLQTRRGGPSDSATERLHDGKVHITEV
jgi:hypothetical protein